MSESDTISLKSISAKFLVTLVTNRCCIIIHTVCRVRFRDTWPWTTRALKIHGFSLKQNFDNYIAQFLSYTGFFWSQNVKPGLIVFSIYYQKYPVCKLSVLAASWTLSEWIFISLAMCALEVIERPLCLLHFGKVDSISFNNNSITLVLIIVGANRGLIRGS